MLLMLMILRSESVKRSVNIAVNGAIFSPTTQPSSLRISLKTNIQFFESKLYEETYLKFKQSLVKLILKLM